MNKDVKLGIEIQKIISFEIKFKELVEFLKGERKETFWFSDLKPLYDEFGYNEVNTIILKLAEEKAVNKNE